MPGPWTRQTEVVVMSAPAPEDPRDRTETKRVPVNTRFEEEPPFATRVARVNAEESAAAALEKSSLRRSMIHCFTTPEYIAHVRSCRIRFVC